MNWNLVFILGRELEQVCGTSSSSRKLKSTTCVATTFQTTPEIFLQYDILIPFGFPLCSSLQIRRDLDVNIMILYHPTWYPQVRVVGILFNLPGSDNPWIRKRSAFHVLVSFAGRSTNICILLFAMGYSHKSDLKSVSKVWKAQIWANIFRPIMLLEAGICKCVIGKHKLSGQ